MRSSSTLLGASSIRRCYQVYNLRDMDLQCSNPARRSDKLIPRRFTVDFSVPVDDCRNSVLKIRQDPFLQHPFSFLIYNWAQYGGL